jgi:hypothetical protein
MKKILFIFYLLSSSFFYSQIVSGTLVNEGREMTSKYDFVIKGKYKGVKYFELAVSSMGEVTGIKEVLNADSFVSSPAKMIALKELYELKFDGATRYPKFQHVLVKVTFKKEN